MKEKKDGVVMIKNMSKETLEVLLEYMYTGTYKNRTEDPEAVYAAAHAYLLTHLMAMIGSELGETITVENVCQRLILSDLYEETNLKDRCLEFIVAKSEEIVKLDAFKNISKERPTVYCDVIARLSKKLNG